jgi:hypothetical protein
VKAGWVDPKGCEHHRLDKTVPRHPNSYRLAATWPYKRPKTLPRKVRRRWLKSPADVQRFGTRGPIDMVPAYHGRFLGERCWDPELFDRNDVAARVLVTRSMYILGQTDRPSYSYLKANWSRG